MKDQLLAHLFLSLLSCITLQDEKAAHNSCANNLLPISSGVAGCMVEVVHVRAVPSRRHTGCAIAAAPTTESDVLLLLALSTCFPALSTCSSAFPVACMQMRASQTPSSE